VLPIREADRVIAGDAFACLFQPRELVYQPARRRMVVVIPVRDEVPGRSLAAEVALVADTWVAFEMDQPDTVIVRNEIPDVRSVGQNEQFRVGRLSLEETRNRLGKPLSPVARQAQARDERVAAGSPVERAER
jgi:hypothetical protein